MNTLPHITTKQQHILKLLYTYRFLNRIQIQAFLHHKDKGLSSKWLKDLKGKHYIEWIYNPDDFAEKTKPAIYYLGINGIRYLREQDDYPPKELRKRYTESKRQRSFIDRCLILADCCLDMKRATTDGDDGRTYSYVTESEHLDPDSAWSFLAESEYIHAHLYYLKEQETDDEIITTHNLLEVIEPTLLRYSLRKKLKDYVNFLDSGEWEEGIGVIDDGNDAGDTLPVIMILCPTKATLIYAKRILRNELVEHYGDDEEDIPEDVHLRLTTVEKIRQHGITGTIWEEAGAGL